MRGQSKLSLIALIVDKQMHLRILFTKIIFLNFCFFPQGGDYHPVRNVEDLRELMATFYNRPVFSTNQRSTPVYTVPYHDGFGFGKCKRTKFSNLVLHTPTHFVSLRCFELVSPSKLSFGPICILYFRDRYYRLPADSPWWRHV